MPTIQTFFRDYAKASLGEDAKIIAAFYSKNFVAVGPAGSAVFTNDKTLIKWLNDVHDFNQKSGLEKMTVKKVNSRAMGKTAKQATVTWGATYKEAKKGIIEFDIHYILEKSGAGWKILLYLSDQDQEKLLKENGIL